MNNLLFDIVIPSWNMSDMAINCLLSIQKNSMNYRVIFVDNGSDEEHFSRIKTVLETLPHLLIRNETNLGFIKATNAGIKASTAPFVVLMNNDTEAVRLWLLKLSRPFSSSREVAAAGPLTTTTDSWQGKYPKGRPGYVIRNSGMLAFFCTMFRREIFDKIGLLDENFGVGFGDDDDYCRRILNAGYKLALVQDLVIPHHHRSTFKQLYAPEKIIEMQTNAINQYHEKHNLKK